MSRVPENQVHFGKKKLNLGKVRLDITTPAIYATAHKDNLVPHQTPVLQACFCIAAFVPWAAPGAAAFIKK